MNDRRQEASRRERHSPVREVQNDIRLLEQHIDETLAGGSDLLARMLRTGKLAGVRPEDGQTAIEAAAACLQAGVAMRAHALDTHERLREITGLINLRELGWGDLVDSPSSRTSGVGEPATSLRIVGEGGAGG